jgi:hypothetical protein
MPTCEELNAASAQPVAEWWIECDEYQKLAVGGMCPVPGCRRTRVPRDYLEGFADGEAAEIAAGLPPEDPPAEQGEQPQGPIRT